MKLLQDLSPKEFEDYVREWLTSTGAHLTEFTTTRLEKISGPGGEYEIDVLVRLQLFSGASLFVLVECKHHAHPIKRDVIMILESKLRDTKAHKGMVFSTADFQSGALTFAKAHRIATLRVTDSGMAYMTRAFSPQLERSTEHACVAWLCEPTESGHSMRLVSSEEGAGLYEWLTSG